LSLIRQFVSTLLIIWLAATLAFFALRVLPGDAIESQLIESGASASTIAERRAAAGLDHPLPTQYVEFLSGLWRGDLGVSLLDGRPVTQIILDQLEPTLTLAFSALAVAANLGLVLGCLAALEIGWGISTVSRVLTALALSVPIYWTGTIAIFVFTVQLDLLPSGGAGRLSQLILPATVLGFHSAGAIAQVLQTGVRETLRAEFVRTARAKGLRERTVVVRHVLRASLLPAVTVLAVQAGFLLSGVVITEALFSRPGIGSVLLDATLLQNYPVVQGVVVWSAVVYALLNSLADSIYQLIDPRVHSEP
jgi:ABC-type dipeptide/oligopeptide/nickel transport system permease component